MQDPDRHCEPVDCAIKYRGFRSFYRNTTGKCEPVVPCHTRGADEISVIAVCHIVMYTCISELYYVTAWYCSCMSQHGIVAVCHSMVL